MDKKVSEKIFNLYCKPAKEQFTEEEVKFLKRHLPKSKWRIKYAFYNKYSSKGCYITFIIDGEPNAVRRSGVENYWTIICERPLSNIEYDEVIRNFGTNHRRFKVWYYDCIEALIQEDKKYYVETPKEFVKQAKEKGYSKSIQLNLF